MSCYVEQLDSECSVASNSHNTSLCGPRTELTDSTKHSLNNPRHICDETFCLSLRAQGANFSCVSGWLRVRGDIRALSDHQQALITQTSRVGLSSAEGDACSAPTMDRYTSTGQRPQRTRRFPTEAADRWCLSLRGKCVIAK